MSENDSDAELTASKRLIVRRSAALFRQKGFSPTTMRDVADVVGLSKAGIYHHYRTKDQLLNDIVATGADALEAQLHSVRDFDGQIQDRFKHYFRTRMRTIVENQDVLTVIWQERPIIMDVVFKDVARRLEKYRAGVGDLIVEGQSAGVIRRDVDPHVFTLAIDGMTGWSYLWYREGGGQTPEEIGDIFWSMLWDSVRAKD